MTIVVVDQRAIGFVVEADAVEDEDAQLVDDVVETKNVMKTEMMSSSLVFVTVIFGSQARIGS